MQVLWNRFHCSVFSLTFINAAGERIASGSGFKAGGYLVTNNHVIQVPSARKVHVRSVGADGSATAFEADFRHLNFGSLMKAGHEEAGWDYAVLDIDNPAFAMIPDLALKETDEFNIGAEACFLGYQFEQSNLAIHRGLVASSYDKAGVRYIQIDGSVNHGNSGGPLIDIADGKVLGIVTRKATGLTRDFEVMDTALASNIQALTQIINTGAMASVMGVDLIGATRMSQAQMRVVARNIERSANVGIGYAYHISEVRDALNAL